VEVVKRMKQLFCLIRRLIASQGGLMSRRGTRASTALTTVAALLVALLTIAAAPAGAAKAAKKSTTPTPIEALDSFAFTFVLSVVGAGTGALTSLTLNTEGTYTDPSNQDCSVTASLGSIKIEQQAVIVGKKTWIDDGSGLEPAKAGDFDFASQCLSDPSFWEDFNLTKTGGLVGTTETKNGIKVEHLDLSGALDQLSDLGLFDDLPDDVTVNTLQAWRASKGGWIAGVDISLTASENATCNEILGDEIPVTLLAPCTVKVAFEVLRPNDKTIKITAPKSGKK